MEKTQLLEKMELTYQEVKKQELVWPELLIQILKSFY